MLKFTTNGKNGTNILTLPTKLEEITSDYLKNVTKEVGIANNYSLIGVCYKEKLSNIIMTSRQRKPNANIAVVPIFIKAGITDSKFVNDINIGDKLIVSPSQISLGHHVAAPKNNLTISTFLFYCEGDNDVYQKALTYSEYVYFLEFKIIPNCDIIGTYFNNTEITEDKTFEIIKADDN